jgi:hypothetical protein
MNAKSRRKLEMGARALDFSRAHPDASAGYTAAVARLEERLARAEQVAARQRDGLLAVRAASARKQELRRAMRQSHLAHLSQVAKAAAREVPEVAEKFRLRPRATTYLGFRTAARGMEAEAQAQKDLLVRHGFVETVLEDLTQALDQFDAAVDSGAEGRAAHGGASAELSAIADEVVQCVKMMNGLNRYRFRQAPELLAAWQSVSNVVAAPRSGGVKPAETPGEAPVQDGDVRPAA